MMSEATALEVEALRAEIQALQGAIRYLRSANHRLQFPPSSKASALDTSWLTEPLVPKPTLAEERSKLLQAEGKDVLKELLGLVTKEGNGVVQLQDRSGEKSGRLGWRPVRETSRWQVEKQREEYEGWREWLHEVGQRGREMHRERERRDGAKSMQTEPLAKVQIKMPGWGNQKGVSGEVRIVRPGEWEDFAGALGLGVV